MIILRLFTIKYFNRLTALFILHVFIKQTWISYVVILISKEAVILRSNIVQRSTG